MSAVVDTAVTEVALTRNTAAEVTYTVATNSGTLVTDTETFDIIPARKDGKFLLLVKNASGATVTVSVLNGNMFASTGDMTGFTVADGKVYGLTIDTAKYMGSDGKINVKVTPTAGTALNASSKVQIGCVQM